MLRTATAFGTGLLLLGTTLVASGPARAGDVSVKLDSGAGFTIKNSTGAIERLRVDEATGNVSRNGALFVHTTGANNLFVGPGAGNTGTFGPGGNSAFGAGALSSNLYGFNNSAIGWYALRSNTSGGQNSALGYRALESNTGDHNSAVGARALQSNTAGAYNSAVGSFALRSNTTGVGNTAAGYGALRANTTAEFNSAFGVRALFRNTAGVQNTAVGYAAAYSNTTGHLNSAVGKAALRTNTTGLSNSAFGSYALRNNSSGNRNIAVGRDAGTNQTTGSDNIYLANIGVAAESGQIKIGTAGTHTATFIAGIRGVTTANANAIPVLIDSAGQLGTVSSSRSVKQDIRDMGDATARLLELRPVTFRYREQQQTLPSGGAAPPEYGLIAEEVADVFPDLVVYDDAGKPFTVKYHELAPMLLNEMKKEHRSSLEQQRVIEAQRQEIATLSARLARIETQLGDARR
ncbi:MAG TPA: tail fiber domain-containing protein [Myxococcota bacterium]|nr:tail fiber domain-containing protein [Myxococcota bacterium]